MQNSSPPYSRAEGSCKRCTDSNLALPVAHARALHTALHGNCKLLDGPAGGAFASARSADSNPGAATPYSLYKLYAKQAAATANPYTLRQAGALCFNGMGASKSYAPVPTSSGTALQLLNQGALPVAPSQALAVTGGSMRGRSDSPPRASFRLLVNSAPQQQQRTPGKLVLSLTSLR